MCLRAFKIHGLSFKVDALNSLLTYIETRVAENPSIDVEVLLNRILNSIDNQHCKPLGLLSSSRVLHFTEFAPSTP
jgi:hypothetical protein